ncbi:hypothetical protein [Brevifollis gellanilyticus]|uniref:hypothetical protein n=1 Tax=Brevifollis gellanilyticus TaxID=748831 RepID=UPI0011BFDBC8|nr:hypothetical protein [Brevifollis gellanilyticus]
MNLKSDSDFFSSIWGTDTDIVVGLTEDSLTIIDDSGKTYCSLSLDRQGEAFPPVGDYSPKWDIFVAAVAPGIVTAIQVSTRKVLWQIKDRRLINRVCILDASQDVVIAGRSAKVLKLADGSPTTSVITDCHSHLDSGNGCFCMKNKTQERYLFSHSSRPGMLLEAALPSLKLSIFTPHFFAAVGFDAPAEVYFLDPFFGKLVDRVVVPDSQLIDALSYDTKEDALLVASHGAAKFIEVWRVYLTGRRELVTTLPQGIGGTSWSFHSHGRKLISPRGRVADLSSGELLRRSWADWQLQEM